MDVFDAFFIYGLFNREGQDDESVQTRIVETVRGKLL